MNISVRARVWIAVGLTVCAAALVVVRHPAEKAASRPAQGTMQRTGGEAADVLGRVETVAASFKVSRTAMRIIPAKAGGSSPAEVRMQVGPDFSTYEFNSALVAAVADLGAGVTGTEHLHDKTVSLQIMKNGAPVALILLDLRPLPQSRRKESGH